MSSENNTNNNKINFVLHRLDYSNIHRLHIINSLILSVNLLCVSGLLPSHHLHTSDPHCHHHHFHHQSLILFFILDLKHTPSSSLTLTFYTSWDSFSQIDCRSMSGISSQDRPRVTPGRCGNANFNEMCFSSV